MADGAVAGITGVIVLAGIAAAGGVAWLVTPSEPSNPMPARGANASVPTDPERLAAGAEPVALEQGRIYYVQLCMDCHGARGDGAGDWAYRVTPRPANLTSARTRARSDSQLFEFISEPQPGTPMVGWKRQLSESQRHQLVGYVRHLSQAGAAVSTR
jgi:mono/diheme cytochrome c family protein